nr:hypothetical protein [Tanacetum cinerariifolium]
MGECMEGFWCGAGVQESLGTKGEQWEFFGGKFWWRVVRLGGEYSQWVKRFMNYLEEQTDGEEMINSIKNGDQPLPRVTQVSIAGTTSTEQSWSDQEKRVQKIDRLARSLLIQALPNDIYSLIDSNKTAK